MCFSFAVLRLSIAIISKGRSVVVDTHTFQPSGLRGSWMTTNGTNIQQGAHRIVRGPGPALFLPELIQLTTTILKYSLCHQFIARRLYSLLRVGKEKTEKLVESVFTSSLANWFITRSHRLDPQVNRHGGSGSVPFPGNTERRLGDTDSKNWPARTFHAVDRLCS